MGMIGISQTRFRLPHCNACGEMRVIHPLEKFLSWVEERTEHESQRAVPLYKQDARAHLRRATFFSSLGIARLHEDPAHSTDSRVHALFEGAAASGLKLFDYELMGKHVTYFLRDDTSSVLSFVHLPHELLKYHSPICIDDKYALAKFLATQGLPAPETWCVKSPNDNVIRQIAKRILVTKPCIGTRGRHTTLHHSTETSLKGGISLALQVSTRVVVQEELTGTVYRLTVVGGKSVYAASREYPCVIGDGTATVTELVSKENTNPIRDGVYFKKMPFGQHEKNFLMSRGISELYVPPPGERCIVSDKNSRRNGILVDDVTESLHESVREYVLQAAQALKSPILGFDVILEDHTIPLNQQKAGIIECNSVPYLDVHHRVAIGRSHNVAAELFSLVIDAYHLQPRVSN